MDEKSLYSLSLISFLIGLFLLIIISEKIDISESNISSLSSLKPGEKVKVKGIVTSSTALENFMLLNIQDKTGNITIVAFNTKDVKINKNDVIEAKGEIVLYKNRVEIEASSIKIF
nr:OB-fold nucleic acid binding domain-containing protein [Candidatus Woesearchaeota archaeon]